MVYADTSVIIKLYIKEKLSSDVSDWIRKNNEAIPLTRFHDLEFTNAIHSKRFRSEITEKETQYILQKLDEHEKRGVYYRPSLEWTDIFESAVDLSNKHTGQIGVRSLDILHIASALTVEADRFLTFDERQLKLATLAGLEIESCVK